MPQQNSFGLFGYEVDIKVSVADAEIRLVYHEGKWLIASLYTGPRRDEIPGRERPEVRETELTEAQASATMALLVGEGLGDEKVQEMYRVIGEVYDDWGDCRPIP